jgi:hypothetical protein
MDIITQRTGEQLVCTNPVHRERREIAMLFGGPGENFNILLKRASRAGWSWSNVAGRWVCPKCAEEERLHGVTQGQ